jgi:hypothetical protein
MFAFCHLSTLLLHLGGWGEGGHRCHRAAVSFDNDDFGMRHRRRRQPTDRLPQFETGNFGCFFGVGACGQKKRAKQTAGEHSSFRCWTASKRDGLIKDDHNWVDGEQKFRARANC